MQLLRLLAVNNLGVVQERAQLNLIADYFHKDIPEVPCNDEDAFLEVLTKAGLTASD